MALFGKKDNEQAEATGGTPEAPAKSSNAAAFVVSDILVQPRLSEKSSHLVSQNKYVFKVKTTANKVEVKKAVEKQYQVKVTRVNMVRMGGKQRRYGATSGKTSDFKKAIVTLKTGDKIETGLEAL